MKMLLMRTSNAYSELCEKVAKACKINLIKYKITLICEWPTADELTGYFG